MQFDEVVRAAQVRDACRAIEKAAAAIARVKDSFDPTISASLSLSVSKLRRIARLKKPRDVPAPSRPVIRGDVPF